MDIKNFIKKKMEKDNTRFLVQRDDFTLYTNLTNLIKYLKNNEMNIEKVIIKLIKEKSN